MHMNCRKCPLGQKSRAVSSEGNRQSPLWIIGRNPGADEEVIGRPFIGKSGELLNLILDSVNIDRKDVYITNLVKCFTEGNRNPNRREIMQCTKKFLEKEIKVGNPCVVIALGEQVIKYLTGISTVAEARKRRLVHPIEFNFSVIGTYHPSFYLRRGKKLKEIKWAVDDFKIAIQALRIYRKYGRAEIGAAQSF